MLKTIYFDLGNVLFFFDHSQMCHQIARCCGLSVDAVVQLLFEFRKIQEDYETGRLDSEGVYRIFRTHSSQVFSFREFLEAISHIFTPNELLWPVVEQLKREKIRLILISNTCEGHYNHLYSHYPILHLFDHKILSFEVGALKPDSRIFQKALAHAGCSIEECFYTDDIPEFVAGAKKEGLDSEVFTDVPTLKNHLVDRGCSFLLK